MWIPSVRSSTSIAILVACAVVLPNTVGAAADRSWALERAEVAVSDASMPPRDAVWRPVTLPDTLRSEVRYAQGSSVWYRFSVGRVPPTEPYALYLWRFNMNVEALFNDELIGSGGSFDEPMARNWNRPFLFRVPASAWREDGENHIYVHLGTYPGWGTFTAPGFGPERVLRPEYETRYFYQITLSQYSFVVTLVVMLFGALFWTIDRSNRIYPFFILANGTWSIYSLNLFVQSIPFSAATWWWLLHTSINVFNLAMVCFAHRLLGAQRPKLEMAMAVMVVAASVSYAAWDLPVLARNVNTVHAIMLGWAVYVFLWISWVALRERHADAIVFAAAFSVMLALAAHDVVLNFEPPQLWANRLLLLQFGAPVLLVVLAIHLGLRLMRALNETRSANVRLERRVQEVTDALEESFAERRTLERRQAANAERDRIYQDLHDDVGARLLSLVYAAGEGRVAELARDSLGAIRSIVSRQGIEGGALSEIAADWRAEVEDRCAAANVELDWRADIDRSIQLSGLQRYHMDNVLRELVSNAIEHSRGRRVEVRMSRNDTKELVLSVGDDGAGFDEAEVVNGSGLAGIRRRVAQLDGVATWGRAGGGSGTVCQVRIPLPPNGG